MWLAGWLVGCLPVIVVGGGNSGGMGRSCRVHLLLFLSLFMEVAIDSVWCNVFRQGSRIGGGGDDIVFHAFIALKHALCTLVCKTTWYLSVAKKGLML